MKIKKKDKKDFDAVKFMRDARDKISKETDGMTFDQLKQYFASKKNINTGLSA